MFSIFLKSNRIVVLFLLPLVTSYFFIPSIILADYMQSSTYKIQSDSLNFGGESSSSSNYNLSDTLGEVATGDSNSASYYMHAGYWQMDESYISISSPDDLVMQSMAGLSGGSSEGTMTWTVTTDNNAGYSMNIATDSTPALKSVEDWLDDYTPSGSDPDYDFTNAPDSSSFGFSPEGPDVISRFKDNGTNACNTGEMQTTAKCWDGLSITPKTIASKTSSNIPSGTDTTVRFRAETGVNHIQTSGVYNVTVTATATTL